MQPRLGATWAYNGKDTVYASYATYNPAASSLPRAASWDRNVFVTLNDYFDPNGVLIGTDPLASSSGKLFVPDLTPRTIYETLVGTSRQFNRTGPVASMGGTAAASTSGRTRTIPRGCRRRRADSIRRPASRASCTSRTWTSNARRSAQYLGPNVLSGSSYVIAELDGAFTKYYEGTLETEWQNDKAFVRGSYTWSHYYGNFDQDSSGVTQRRERLHRLVEHRRRRGTPAVEQPLRRPARRSASLAEALRLSRAARGTRPPGSTPSRSPASHGRRGATSRTSRSRRTPATRPDSPNRQAHSTLRRTGRSI